MQCIQTLTLYIKWLFWITTAFVPNAEALDAKFSWHGNDSEL